MSICERCTVLEDSPVTYSGDSVQSFDITRHQFLDEDIAEAYMADDVLFLVSIDDANDLGLYKTDAIAVAKAHGLTAEDLM